MALTMVEMKLQTFLVSKDQLMQLYNYLRNNIKTMSIGCGTCISNRQADSHIKLTWC